MFKFCNLYSGSSGNCSFVETENTKILVDMGVSNKKLEDGLKQINVDIKDIDAIILTHEHSDHVKGLPVTTNKYHIPVYANRKTFEYMKQDLPDFDKNFFVTGENFDIGDLKIHPFSIPHDAADPCGFTISHKKKKISIATDIGHIENSVIDNLVGNNFVLIEANYETEMLKSSRYPYLLKRRILGPDGHLSNEDASYAISTLCENGVNNIMLGHLSKENNFPELAYQTVMNEIMYKINDEKFSLAVADRDTPNKIIKIA